MTDESPTPTGAGLEADGGAALEAVPSQGEGGPAGPPSVSGDQGATPPRQTVAGRVWVSIGFAIVLLVLLIIFISENSHDVRISFLGATGTLSLALAMLASAVAGALITLLVGTTRIVQLRREVHRQHRRARQVSSANPPAGQGDIQ
jgi:lipopolysaccharide assembly protein A